MIDIHYLGHAAFALDFDGIKVLIDPYLTGNPGAPIKPDEAQADFILITHGHGDHVGDTEAISRRTGALAISNAEISQWLSNKGIKAQGQHIGGGHDYPFGYLKLTQALHGSSMPDGAYGGNPAGLLITAKSGQRLYFAGDTGLFGDMGLIGEEGIDFAALPIGDNYTMGPEDALRAVKLIHPRVVVPMHYNTFDQIQQDAKAWAARVESETDTKAVVLSPGEHFTL